MTLTLFLTVAALHVLAAISPGPAFVVSVRVAVSEGFRPALGVAAGFGLGAAIYAAAALAGLAALFAVAPVTLTILKWAGAAFLVWLALQMWRHARDPLPVMAVDRMPRGPLSAVRLGLVTQLANPKAAVFFGAVFVGLIPPDTSPAVLAALVAVILVNETLWYGIVGRLFSAPPARAVYARAKAGIDRLFGGLLTALAARIAIG